MGKDAVRDDEVAQDIGSAHYGAPWDCRREAYARGRPVTSLGCPSKSV
jgi:hypothetical protein